MVLLCTDDILPVLISSVLFSFLAISHRVLIPSKYSALLQFKQEEDSRKTAQSTAIRILYLIVGTIFLAYICNFSKRQIAIGVFLSCFLNVWPAIIQNHLLKIRKSKHQWLLLLGYIVFIVFSVLISVLTIDLFMPVLFGERELYWLDNQAITLMSSLILMAVPIPVEMLISKFTSVVIVQTVDTFKEEVYIVENQLNMTYPEIQLNRFYIDDTAVKYDLNVDFLTTLLKLEIFYRGRMYYKMTEWLMCHFLPYAAIKKDISAGIAQIRISTAQKILHQNPNQFVAKLTDDNFNIDICGRYIKSLIEEYNYKIEKEPYTIGDMDIFDYIACSYLGGETSKRERTILIYSSVLRSISVEGLQYCGSGERTDYRVEISSGDFMDISEEQFSSIVDSFSEHSIIESKNRKCCGKINITLYCRDQWNFKQIKRIAEKCGLQMLIKV